MKSVEDKMTTAIKSAVRKIMKDLDIKETAGKWVPYETTGYTGPEKVYINGVPALECSACGFTHARKDGQLMFITLKLPYCPYCGAKMEVEG